MATNEINLVDLQKSSKKICNPFGFDFKTTWGKKPVVVPGDGQWYSMIGRLRDHVANRLYQKVYYQYHDEQVAKLKEAGRDKVARQYNVPESTKNKIWFLITGEPMPGKQTTEEIEQDEADLSVLSKELSSFDKEATTRNEVMSVSELIDKANAEAVAAVENDGSGSDSMHVSGSGKANDAVIPEAAEPDLVTASGETVTKAEEPEAVEVKQEVQDPAGPKTQPQDGEFSDLAELDNAPATA